MTSPPPGSGSHDDAAPGTPAACKRPGCPNTLPPRGRGRGRQFCSDDCARRYHNDARIPAPASGTDSTGGPDPLTTLETLTRQAAVLIRAARDQAAYLDPANVRVLIADAGAARHRAEAAAVTAQARAAEATTETETLTEALTAARDAQQAAETAASNADAAAQAATAELQQAHRDAREQIAAATTRAHEHIAAAQQDAARHARERDDALAAARHADTEISRARQAETDARAETAQARADAARERDTLREHHQAQLAAASALTAAEQARAERAETQLETERADRRHLTRQLTATPSPADPNGHHPSPAGQTRTTSSQP